jgi:hypothetical protein
MLYASDARSITKLAKEPVNPWCKLFERIKENAEQGQSSLSFDEAREGVFFTESRQAVKTRLEELGYTVSYSKVKNECYYYGDKVHNRYLISW